MAVMLVVQFGIAYHLRTVLSGAAQDGAAAGARLDASPADGAALAEALIGEAGSTLLSSSSVTAARSGDVVVVTASGEVVSLIPFVGTIEVNATGSAPVEEFRPQGG